MKTYLNKQAIFKKAWSMHKTYFNINNKYTFQYCLKSAWTMYNYDRQQFQELNRCIMGIVAVNAAKERKLAYNL